MVAMSAPPSTLLAWLRGFDVAVVEAVIVAAGLAVAAFAHHGRRLPQPRRWAWYARRPVLVGAGLGLLGAGLTAALALGLQMPEPRIHDEFGYILAADTYAHGRLANPVPREWQAFETFHVLMDPAYAAMFPPGQGLVFALGQLLGGAPVVGLWLGVGLACAALHWMLRAWVGERWALVGGLIAVAWMAPSYWGQSYWGGAVTAAGGALLLGALRRLPRQPTAMNGALFGLGLAALANTRPYEGGVVALAALVWLGLAYRRLGRAARALMLRRAGVPLTLVLAASLGFMAWYNYRVTGSPLKLPHAVHAERYATTPVFFWQARWHPEIRVPEMRFFAEEAESYSWQRQQTREGFIDEKRKALNLLHWFFFGGPALYLSLVALPWLMRRRWLRFALAASLVLLVALLLTSWYVPHYAAPGAGLLLILLVAGLKRIATRAFRAGLPAAAVGAVVAALYAGQMIKFAQRESFLWQLWPERRQVLERLDLEPGKQLVFVHYRPEHSVHDEWVFNRADLDAARVVWARDQGEEVNRRVVAAYPGRRVWLLDPDPAPAWLRPYPGTR